MDLKEVKVEYKDGKAIVVALGGSLVLTLDAGLLLVPLLVAVKEDFDSGKIDLIKGTDLDKVAAVGLLEGAIALLEGK